MAKYLESLPPPMWAEPGARPDRPRLHPPGVSIALWHRQIGAHVSLTRIDTVADDDGQVTEGPARIRLQAADLAPGQARRVIAELAAAADLAAATGSAADVAALVAAAILAELGPAAGGLGDQ
jgi:hypothetical protein